ncbi:MAG: glycosyltransferase family 9 protein [Bacteroidales bacterium]|nr:glycosyltransferase family 9 protein [Bacteroidales bacterium]
MSLLVIRTSSMGDVIMTLPLLQSFASAYPDKELVFVTKRPYDHFVSDIPGIRIFLSDHHGRHRGLPGLFRLWRELRVLYHITAVADLHDVIRSKIVRTLFRLDGCRIAVTDKERTLRRRLVHGRLSAPLTHTVERYRDAFARAGYPLEIVSGPWLQPSPAGDKEAATQTEGKVRPLIGVAPLARHRLKMWPAEHMEAMLRMLSAHGDCTIFLFGSPDEAPAIREMASRVPGAIPVAGTISLDGEIALISQLTLMLAMDSSNMHLAAMLGVDTLSIWGATHPRAGFSAWGMPEENQIQIPDTELTCRPCTIYGKGECRRGDLACLEWITPEMVLKKVLARLKRV